MEGDDKTDLKFCFDVKSKDRVERYSLSQNQRRKKMLKKQKERKANKLEHLRQLALEVDANSDDEGVNEIDNSMTDDSMIDQADQKEKKEKKSNNLYRNHLMKHELLEELPSNMITDWLCIPIPEGERCLVISSKCATYVRSMDGKLLYKFQSLLPAGSRLSNDGKKVSYCLFDCIFHSQSNTFYILDMMCWKANLYYQCDSAFRFFFLQSKITEIPYVSQISDNNPYRFIPLPTFYCTLEGIELASNNQHVGFNPTFITFYDKNSHYTINESNPLVCYLPMDKIPSLKQSIKTL